MKKTLTTTMLIASAVFALAENDVPATDVPANDAPVLGPAPANAPDAELSEIEKIRAEMHKDPMKTIPVFVNAARHMKTAIDDELAIIAELKLADTDIENMPPEEQFELIANALNTVPATPAQKRSAIEQVFGPHNAEIVDYFVSDKTRTEYASAQLREAHVLFSEYVTPTDVDNWGWGKAYGLNANLTMGTLGIGLDLGYEINKHWKVRAHYGRGSLSGTMHIHDANINAAWENNDNIGVFVDWHPKGSQFHVTAGLMYSDPRIKLWGDYHAVADTIKQAEYTYTTPDGVEITIPDGSEIPTTQIGEMVGSTAYKEAYEQASQQYSAAYAQASQQYSAAYAQLVSVCGEADAAAVFEVNTGFSTPEAATTAAFTAATGFSTPEAASVAAATAFYEKYASNGDISYEVDSHYNMDGSWDNKVQPYVGFGWSSDGGKDRTLYFTLDVGLIYVGGSSYQEDGGYEIWRIDNTTGERTKIATGTTKNGATPGDDFGTYESDIPVAAALQRMDGNIRNFIDKVAGFLDDMYVYPVIQFGGGIRF